MKHLFVAAFRSKVTLAFILGLFFTFSLSAQTTIGRQKVDQYPTQSWGAPTYGLTWLPNDYATSGSQTYPLIIFLHGAGEVGDGVNGLNKLISTALPQKIAQGWDPEAVNPSTGQNTKFIVVSPQAPSSSHWSYNAGPVSNILADVISRYRVDPSRVYVTGLSAGGAGSWSCVTNGIEFAKKITAIVPVSAAGNNYGYEGLQMPLVGGVYGVKVWSVCGANDAWFSFSQSATNTLNSANPIPSVPAVCTGIPGLDHQALAWNTAYNPSWRSNQLNLNIYEWMLQYSRGNSPALSLPVPVPNQEPSVNAGADQVVTTPPSTTTLSGTASDPDGNIASYLWTQVSGPSTAGFSSSRAASTTVNGLITGTYVFRFTVADNSGATASDDVVVVVTASSTVVGTTARIEGESYSNQNGINTEPATDAGGGLNIGWVDDGDWMDYSVNVAQAGVYTVNFRVASLQGGGKIQLRKADGTVLTEVTTPNTGNWQSWITVSSQVTLNGGQQTLRVYASTGGWNLNWFELQLTAASGSGSRIQAEFFSSQNGVQADNCNDAGGGQYVGWIDAGDWMDYAVNNSQGGSYTVNFRISSIQASQFQIRRANGIVLATVNVPNTGGWDNYANVSAQVNLPAGDLNLRIFAISSGWNINWFEFAGSGTIKLATNHIEAEAFASQSGIQTDLSTDVGGSQYVGWTDAGDWMDYAVNVPQTGNYIISFRIATIQGSQIQLRKADGSLLTTVSFPNTGGWQTWTTVTAQVSLTAGQQTLRIASISSGWNMNWFEFAAGGSGAVVVPTSAKIEAESYTNMSGIQKEPTSDAGGGEDVGYQDNNDWMDYTVTINSTGNFTMNFRVATISVGTQFQVRKADGTVLTTVTVPSTGGWQNWTTISAQVSLPQGVQTLRIYTLTAINGWNINWFEITDGQTSTTSARGVAVEEQASTDKVSQVAFQADVYPNPVTDRFALKLAGADKGAVTAEIYSMDGRLEKTYKLQKGSETSIQFYLSAQGLAKGEHLLRIIAGKNVTTKALIKL